MIDVDGGHFEVQRITWFNLDGDGNVIGGRNQIPPSIKPKA